MQRLPRGHGSLPDIGAKEFIGSHGNRRFVDGYAGEYLEVGPCKVKEKFSCMYIVRGGYASNI